MDYLLYPATLLAGFAFGAWLMYHRALLPTCKELADCEAALELTRRADRAQVKSHAKLVEQYHRELASQKQLLKEAYAALHLRDGKRKAGEVL